MSPDIKMKTLLMYWSATGNTEKVARTIQNVLNRENVDLEVQKIGEGVEKDLLPYDLVIMGVPSYNFLPPEPVLRYVRQQMKNHVERGQIKPGAPKVPGKTAVVFCTYSGPHTGIREAITAGEYLGQFFEHLGFNVGAKWYIVGEFHGRLDLSTQGPLGDIRGRPDQKDLAEVENNLTKLIISLRKGA
jgi:flavodoxin